MYRYLFLAIACMSGIAANSQDNLVPFSPKQLVPGYVVLEFGDTLKGNIQLVGYQTAPDYVYFSNEKFVNGRRFTVEDCKAFGTEEETYQRWIVRMDLSFFNRVDYVIHHEDSIVIDTVFLKQAYKGTTFSLFKYYKGNEGGFLKPEDEKMHFFSYDQRNETMQELILKYRNPNRGRKIVVMPSNFSELMKRQEIAVYRDQFNAYFGFPTEKNLQKKIRKLAYKEYDLVKILKELNAYIEKQLLTQ